MDPVTQLGQPLLSPSSSSGLCSAPAAAGGDRGVVTDTRAACVPQGQGVFILIKKLRGVKVDQGGQGKFH